MIREKQACHHDRLAHFLTNLLSTIHYSFLFRKVKKVTLCFCFHGAKLRTFGDRTSKKTKKRHVNVCRFP